MNEFKLTDIKPFKSNALKLSLYIIGTASLLYYSVIAGFLVLFFDDTFLEIYSLETLVIVNGIVSFVFLWFVFLFGLLFHSIQEEIYYRNLTADTSHFPIPELMKYALQNKKVRHNIFKMLDDDDKRGEWNECIEDIKYKQKGEE